MINTIKTKFDTDNTSHLVLYRNFLKTKSWGQGCPFHLEWPYTDIPVMIERKLIDRHLSNIINFVDVSERSNYITTSDNVSGS